MKSDDRGGYRLPLLPLRDIIVFPHMVVPLFVGRDKSLSALEEAMAGDKQILLAAQRRAKTDDPNEEDILSAFARSRNRVGSPTRSSRTSRSSSKTSKSYSRLHHPRSASSASAS
jgi:ATP-dependent Lon protease